MKTNRTLSAEVALAPKGITEMGPQTHLSVFPTELLLHIGSFILSPSDLFHLLLTCRRFTSLCHAALYADNVRNWRSSCLSWACRTGRLETVRHALAAGASPNTLFFEDQRKLRPRSSGHPRFKLFLPMAHVRDLLTIPLAATPLSLAAQRRHSDIVQLLLENGADASGVEHCDRAPARYHHRVWKPLHWALCCGRFYNDDTYPSTATPVPVSAEITAALLGAGADPNALTLADPVWGVQHEIISTEPTIPLVMASCCAHAPAEAVRLLLDAGADPSVNFSAAGCRGFMRVSCGDLLYWLEKSRAVMRDGDAERDKKLLHLLRADRRSTWIRRSVVNGETVGMMLERVTSDRVDVAEILWELPSRMTVSGVYALIDVWVREREALGQLEDGGAEPAREALKNLEQLIARICGFQDITYQDRNIARHAVRVDLGAAFSEFCNNAANGDIQEFVRLLGSQGIFRGRAGSRPSVSDAVQQKFEMFKSGSWIEYPYKFESPYRLEY
ncbi:hypothetical protein GGR58DRAFT_524352 [Xylaria digitata]|nr:hypothetical protein GGR58DRAFT_524352 [Xylaria digitata]